MIAGVPLAAYVWLTFALVVTPGASTAVVIRSALHGGWRRGVVTAAGIAVANSIVAAAAGLGLAWVIGRSPVVLTALQVGGGVYLAWLAVSCFHRAWRGGAFGDRLQRLDPAGASAFGEGLLVNLMNPPIVTFYLIVVPGFLTAGAPRWAFALLAAIHVTMAFVVHLGWTIGFDRMRHVVHRPGPMRALETGAGIALLVLAARTLRSAISA
jgi:threonine/homoserine/homoserine lactone efflux protein